MNPADSFVVEPVAVGQRTGTPQIRAAVGLTMCSCVNVFVRQRTTQVRVVLLALFV